MKLLIVTLTIVACRAALPPSKSYLPQTSDGRPQFLLTTFTAINSGSSALGDRRPQQEVEKNAAVLKLDQDMSENGFYYDYKTSNGISAHESGDASGSKGGFSYTDDDGLLYSIEFISGKDGFQAAGAHLPVTPPTPEAILLALQQNAKDEAAGIFDDGQYRPDKLPRQSSEAFSSGSSQSSFSSI